MTTDKNENSRSLSTLSFKGAPNLRAATPALRATQSPKAASFDGVKARSTRRPTQMVLTLPSWQADRIKVEARGRTQWVSSMTTAAELVALVNGVNRRPGAW